MGAVRAILWKEVREQVFRNGRVSASFYFSLAFQVILAVGAPVFIKSLTASFQTVPQILALLVPVSLGAVGFFALMTPLGMIIDAAAGERERHTLETLLASPAGDRAILMGKALAVFLTALVQAGLFAVASGVTWTVLFGPLGLLSALLLVAVAPAIVAVTASYTIGLGLVISRRSATVKQGQQTLSYAMMPFFLLPAFGSFIGSFVGRAGPVLAMAIGIGAAAFVFVGLNALWWALALRGWKRDRLMAKRT